MTSTVQRGADVVHLPPDRWRESYDLFRAALHLHPASDERWAQVRELYRPDRVYGVFAEPAGGDQEPAVVGTFMYSAQGMTTPGGEVVPAYGGTSAGVRADRAGRGLFGPVITSCLRDMAERGEALLMIRPSTGDLWQRWGTGPAARSQGFRVDRLRARPRPDLAHRRERVRRLDPGTDLAEALPPVHRRAAAARPGTVVRSAAWWACWNPHAWVTAPVHAAVVDGPDGPEGYVTWWVEYQGDELAAMRRIVHVVELFAATATGVVDLWSYVLGLPLVEEVRASGRPLDEPVPLLLTDERACEVGPVRDELWLRIVDVAEALRLRGWAPTAGDSVVLEVFDDQLPHNAGRYRIGSDGVERTGRAADLSCSVLHLATMYLGDRAPSQLAAAGLLDVHDPAAADRADRLFAVRSAPWGGSMF
jgi:predicted acetyltransferase